MKKTVLHFLCLVLMSCILVGCGNKQSTFYVSVSGNDNSLGTIDAPFATLNKAHDAALKEADNNDIVIYLREGAHYISQPIKLTSADLRSKYSIKYTSYEGENAAISTSKVLSSLVWKDYKNGIMQTEISDASIIFDQLFVDGQKQHMARYPNYDKTIHNYNGYAADAISPDRVKNWINPAGGFVHAMHKRDWGGYQYQIKGKSESGELLLEGGFQNNRQMGMHDNYRMVENIFEELDVRGEWYFDTSRRTLYFYPPEGTDLSTAMIETPQLESIFIIQGNEQNPVTNIEISSLELKHTIRTFMKTAEPLLRSDWTIYRAGAISIEGAENCVVNDCYIHDIGGNAIMLSNYNRKNTIKNNHITEVGASGISFVGSPKAVRSPSFEYNEYISINEMDTIAGPLSNDYPAECIADNNLIHNIGTVEKQIAGVQIAMSKNITVSHNSIYDLPRAGINIGDGTWGGHIIEWNDVFDTVLETGDHGSFNSWGRDRFWHPKREYMDSLNKTHPQLVKLDAIETTILRNNRWRCDHGWDIDLDDGSSNYHIYNNLCLKGGIKLREGFNRVVENNIMIGNSFHPHVWFQNSGDVFKHNIVTEGYKPIRVKEWGKEVDFNFLPDSTALAEAQKTGTDMHSLSGNPMFTNSTSGDYRVDTKSPALKIGFKNFDMDKFGVQYEKLKQIAKKPIIPNLDTSQNTENGDSVHKWLGGELKTMSTLGERSATGMDAIKGVIVLNADESSVLARSGLKSNDVILGFGKKTIDRWEDLSNEIEKAARGKDVTVIVFRDQNERKINIRIP